MYIGLPATGKSTLIGNKPNVISTDNIIQKLADTRNLTYNEVWQDNIKEAEKEFWNTFDDLVYSGVDIIIDRTNMSSKVRKRFFDGAKGYRFVAHIVECDTITWIKRVTNRPGKTIPWNVITSMANHFEYPTYDEGFHEIHRHITS
jgi:predicted kinase